MAFLSGCHSYHLTWNNESPNATTAPSSIAFWQPWQFGTTTGSSVVMIMIDNWKRKKKKKVKRKSTTK